MRNLMVGIMGVVSLSTVGLAHAGPPVEVTFQKYGVGESDPENSYFQ